MKHELGIKRTALIMGMPIIVEVRDQISDIKKSDKDIEKVFDYFRKIDAKYSPFKKDSEVSKYNRKEKYSKSLDFILKEAGKLKKQTAGYFDVVKPNGFIDPSGIVKGWAIKNAADILKKLGYRQFYIDAGGDVELVGRNWKWGIRNPFNVKEVVKILKLSNRGIATSGTYERGQHIYDPIGRKNKITDIVSLSVIGKNVYEADKFATPAFAMGKAGINFIESKKDLEGYMIDKNGIATMTSKFIKYLN